MATACRRAKQSSLKSSSSAFKLKTRPQTPRLTTSSCGDPARQILPACAVVYFPICSSDLGLLEMSRMPSNMHPPERAGAMVGWLHVVTELRVFFGARSNHHEKEIRNALTEYSTELPWAILQTPQPRADFPQSQAALSSKPIKPLT